jgi:hypothetical protein
MQTGNGPGEALFGDSRCRPTLDRERAGPLASSSLHPIETHPCADRVRSEFCQRILSQSNRLFEMSNVKYRSISPIVYSAESRYNLRFRRHNYQAHNSNYLLQNMNSCSAHVAPPSQSQQIHKNILRRLPLTRLELVHRIPLAVPTFPKQ